MTQNDICIEIRQLKKSYGQGEAQVRALDEVDLKVSKGEFVAIMGPSGSGKSTLLHAIGGLISFDGGELLIENQDIAKMDDDARSVLRRRRIGFVYQAFNLIDILSAEENVALPMLIDGCSEHEALQAARLGLEKLGLRDRLTHLPSELSGGERQRTAIARALLCNPAMILADEPTGNLDSQNGAQIMTILRQLVDDEGQTVLMVTHDADHARIADRILTFRDGRIEGPRS